MEYQGCRNTLWVQLDKKSTSGNLRLTSAAGAKSGGSVFFSNVKGHDTDFYGFEHLYVIK